MEESGKEKVEEEICEYEREFKNLFRIARQELSQRKTGEHEIEVAEVMTVGMFACFLPEVAIVKDIKGGLWAIPEDRSSRKNRLVSRWSVRAGMRLGVEVTEESGEKNITGVLV